MSESTSNTQVFDNIRNILSTNNSTEDDDVIELIDVIHDDEQKVDQIQQSEHKSILNKISNTLQNLEKNQQKNIVDTNMEDNYLGNIKNSVQALKDVKRANNCGTSVESLVSDIIKPHIEKWLENNLAQIVEREVKKAITKITED